MNTNAICEKIDQVRTASAKERQRIADDLTSAGADAAPRLIGALNDQNRFVRLAAADVLGKVRATEAVPALIRTMGDGIVRVRRAAMGALISIGTDAVAEVRAACDCGDPVIQRHAFTVLRRLEVWEAVPEALRALHSDHHHVRREAAKLLLASGDEHAFDDATDCLSDKEIADTVANELLSLGERGRQALLDAAHSEDRVARRAAAVALAKEGGPETLGKLLDSYAEDDLTVSWEAPGMIEAAVNAGREVPFEKLLAQASGESIDRSQPHWHHNQRPAIAALGKIGDPRAIPTLAGLVENEHAVVARLAVAALAEIGTEGCVQPIVNALGHSHASVRQEARRALSGMPEAASTALFSVLSSDHRARRENAALALAECGPQAVDGLMTASRSDDPIERWMAFLSLEALITSHGEDVAERIREAARRGLGDADPRIRRFAVKIEKRLRDEAALPLLVKLWTDEDRQVRRSSADALAAFGADTVVGEIESRRGSCEVATFDSLGRALGATGEAAIEPALRLAEDPNPLVRRAAGVALVRCKRAAALPGLVALAHDADERVSTIFQWASFPKFLPLEATAEFLENLAQDHKVSQEVRETARRELRQIRKLIHLQEGEPDENGEGDDRR